MEQPRIEQIKNGWAALGNGWAVFGTTKEEALAKFREAEERHKLIAARAEPVSQYLAAKEAQDDS